MPTEHLDDPYEPAADADAVRGSVMAPAIILIIVNVLNLLIGLAAAGNGANCWVRRALAPFSSLWLRHPQRRWSCQPPRGLHDSWD